MARSLSLEQLESLRDETYFRTAARRVRTVEEAARFVDANGLAFAFSAEGSELPCLWHAACGCRTPEMPVHTHHDPNIGLVWQAKDVLPMRKRIYYGKALKKRPTMISLGLFPSFYATKGYPAEPIRRLSRDNISPIAYRIAKVLEDGPPRPTKELKMAAGCSRTGMRYAFDRAMAELQERLLIIKIAEEYEPFTFIWGRLDRWLVQEVEKTGNISASEGRRTVLEKYFSRVVAARADHVKRLFGWPDKIVKETIASLLEREKISDGVDISGGKWYIHSSFC